MVQEVLISISLIIVVAAILTTLLRVIKQPPIIAYLITGIVVGPLFLNLIGPESASTGLLQILAHIGVAFLLFIVGLSLDLRVLKEVGGVATFGGLAEVILTASSVFFIALGLGFQNMTALYLGAALAFSSTVVVVKILSDKKEIDSLHGRIALGILIVEDFIAALALMAIPLISTQASSISIIEKLGIIIGLIALIFIVANTILRKILDYLARNQEALFLFGIAWALVIATIFDYLGFSLEIGALIAGMSIASSKYNLELGGKMKPLRDFFVILFFVFFGSQLTNNFSPEFIKQAVIFSGFILIGKPIIVMIILRLFGYKKRTNFLAGSSLAQISEFSLILILLGFNLGIISHELMNLVIVVALITIAISSYSIYYSHTIFSKLQRTLGIFEGKSEYEKNHKEKKYDIIIFGAHRLGYKIIEALKKTKYSYLVVDYNPKVIYSLTKQGINCIYGDGGNADFLSEIPIKKSKLIISTIPDESSNIIIKENINKVKAQATFMATVEQPREALELYSKGVDYVIIPHHLGGELISTIINAFGLNKDQYKKLGQDHKAKLKSSKNSSDYPG